MVPDIELRLNAILRAMRETIIPSLDPLRKDAVELAYLVVGHLTVISDQISLVPRYYLAEIRDFSALISELLDCASGGVETVSGIQVANAVLGRTKELIALKIPATSMLEAGASELKAAADRLVKAALLDGDLAFQVATRALVLNYAERQIIRDRVWTRGSKLDLEAERQPPIETLL
jgi:hypothetical protein